MSDGVPYPTYRAELTIASAYKLITDLENLGILEEITGNKRSKSYLFREYIDLFK